MKKVLFVLLGVVLYSFSVRAEDVTTTKLMKKVAENEQIVADLTGQLERAHHTNRKLREELNKVKFDTDLRLDELERKVMMLQKEHGLSVGVLETKPAAPEELKAADGIEIKPKEVDVKQADDVISIPSSSDKVLPPKPLI